MKIGIIGAGLCGLATTYYFTTFLDRGLELDITLLDPNSVGDNTSGIAAGLFHPYAGVHAKKRKNADDCQVATLDLLKIAENALEKPISQQTGFLRVAITSQQKKDFALCAKNHDDVYWLEADECQLMCPGLVKEPGIFITSGHIIQTKQYLKGLWKHCKNKGVKWKRMAVSSLKECADFDAVIVATGAATKQIEELSHLRIGQVKGQILEIEWPSDLPPLKVPVNSKAYIVPGKKCILGATFERNFQNQEPDISVAKAELIPQFEELFPGHTPQKIISCRSGVRATAPGHVPMGKQINSNTWIITGMGSKGLLQHALYSKKLVDDVMKTQAPSLFS